MSETGTACNFSGRTSAGGSRAPRPWTTTQVPRDEEMGADDPLGGFAMAGAVFMSSLFRVDLPGYLQATAGSRSLRKEDLKENCTLKSEVSGDVDLEPWEVP